MQNLGLMNDWFGTNKPNKKPDIVIKCEELKHSLTGECRETSSVGWSCYSTVKCEKCGYTYNIDSSG